MDLGKARLRKVGLNNLHSAVHPQHGVIWTDGKAIYLAPIHVEGRQQCDERPLEHPQRAGEACHMCVVHQQNVTVWRVSGSLPKLNFKQVRKINVKTIPQGCLWNPCNDVLCLLSRNQCSFYYRHDSNKGSYAFPSLESGKILCGCWSPDGKKLVLCVGTALLIYRWNDVSASVGDFAATAWKVPGLEGQVVSISPVLKDSVVVATEIPLENLCRQQDMFKVPDANGDTKAEDGIIRPNKSSSATHSLLNLQENTQAVPEASSTLTLVNLHDGSKDPNKLSSVPLKGVLTPDILLYEKSSQCVVVGSNSQSQLHIYALLEKHLAYCGDIQLDKGQRPKGLCSMPTYFDDHGAALLILVGQRESEETGLLSPSTESDFKLSLKYIILKAGYDHRSKTSSRGDSVKSRSTSNLSRSGLMKSESMKEHRVKHTSDANLRGRSGSEKIDHQPMSRSKSPANHNEIKLPMTPPEESPLESNPLLTQPPVSHIVHKQKMIEDLSDSSDSPNPENMEVERVPFSSQSPSFENPRLTDKYELHAAPRNKSKAMKEKRNSLHNSPPRNTQLREANMEAERKSGGILKSSPSKQVQPQPTQTSQSQEHLSNEVALQSTKSTSNSSNPNIPQTHKNSSQTNMSTTNGEWKQHQQSSAAGVTSIACQTEKESPRHLPSLQTGHLPCIVEAKSELSPGPDVTNQSFRPGDADSVDGAREDTLSDLGFGSSLHSADYSCDSMERQVKSQKENLDALQRRLEELSVSVEETCCVFPTKYQDMSKPEMVEIYCEKPEGTETKRFLLDNGRLQLEPVKLAFGLVTVELWLDGIPCVLGANIDGYIPMKFEPTSKLHISGRPSVR